MSATSTRVGVASRNISVSKDVSVASFAGGRTDVSVTGIVHYAFDLRTEHKLITLARNGTLGFWNLDTGRKKIPGNSGIRFSVFVERIFHFCQCSVTIEAINVN